MPAVQAIPIALLTQSQHKLSLITDISLGIVQVKGPHIHLQRVDIILRIRGQVDDRSLVPKRLCDIEVFQGRVDHDDIVLRPQKHLHHLGFTEIRFSASGYAEHHPVAIRQILPVSKTQVMGHLVDAVADTALLIQLLHIKRQKCRDIPCQHGTECGHLPSSYRKHCIQRFQLLIIMRLDLAHPPVSHVPECLRNAFQFLFFIRHDNHVHTNIEQVLVILPHIVHDTFDLFFLHLLNVGNIRRKIVVFVTDTLLLQNVILNPQIFLLKNPVR